MKSAAKGIVLLVVALAAVIGVTSWLLNHGAPSDAAGSRTDSAAARAHADGSAPASAGDAKSEASRAETERAGSASSGEAARVGATAAFLSGIVVDPNGAPVANAEVRYGPTSFLLRGPPRRPRFGGGLVVPAGRRGEDAPPAPVKTRTGADGSFKLTHLPLGDGQELAVDEPDHVVYKRNDLIVPEAGLNVGRIELEPGAAVSGQVFAPGGAKLANADISLRDADTNDPQRLYRLNFLGNYGDRTTTTDAEGRFRVSGLPKGKAVVVAKAAGFAEGESSSFELKPLEEVQNVVVNVERGDTIRGLVHDEKGKPIAGAGVDAEDAGGNGLRRMTRFFASSEPMAKTDERGAFAITGLKPGNFDVTVEAAGFAHKTLSGVDSSSGEKLDFAMGEGLHVSGRVRFKDGPDAVKNVKVEIAPYWGDGNGLPTNLFGEEKENHSQEEGAFLIRDVDPGRYRVAALGDGAARTWSAPIEVTESKSVEDVEIVLDRGASIEGHAIDPTGAPLADAAIEVAEVREQAASDPNTRTMRIVTSIGRGPGRVAFGDSRSVVARVKTDSEGRFLAEHLNAGRFTAEASHQGYAVARSDALELNAGEQKQGVEIHVGRGATVTGHVLGLDGKPRAGDRIDVESETLKGVSLSGISDADGFYRIEHLPPGDCVAKRSEPDNSRGRAGMAMTFRAVTLGGNADEPDPGKRFSCAEGETVTVDFAQMERPFIEGIVRCADGVVGGATVSARPDSGGGRSFFFGDQKRATTNSDGSYRLTDLDPGSYIVSVRHPQALVPTTATVVVEKGSNARQDFMLDGGVIEGTVHAQKNAATLDGALIRLERARDDGNAGADVQSTFAIDIAFAGPGRGQRAGRPMRFRGNGGDFTDNRVLTDHDGHFRVPWVPAGKYVVHATLDGFLEGSSTQVELKENDRVDHADVSLPPAGRVLVHVREKATGRPISDAPVTLIPDDGGQTFEMTDGDGVAHFNSVKPGPVTISVRRDWRRSEEARQSTTAIAEREVELTIDD